MKEFFTKLSLLFSSFTMYDAVDIFLLSIVVYITFKFLLNHNSLKLIKIFILIIIAMLLINIFDLRVLGNIGKYLLLLGYILIVVLYASEIKRDIWARSKRISFDLSGEHEYTEEDLKFATEEIVKAVQNMAKRDIGALIVFIEGQTPLSILESGVPLYGVVSSQLVESIFIPKSPLHDGAVLIKGNKVLAAGCFLPLSQEINLSKDFGTRHRAAIGITEQHNVTAIVVSEETGIISIARSGQLKRYLDGDMLRQSIEEVYGLAGKKEQESGLKLRKRR